MGEDDIERSAAHHGFRHGAFALGDGTTRFSVWAPKAERVELLLEGPDGAAEVVAMALSPVGDGYNAGIAPASPGTRYRYRLGRGGPLADPATRRRRPQTDHTSSHRLLTVGPT